MAETMAMSIVEVVVCARAGVVTMAEAEAMDDVVAATKEETMAVEVLAAAAAVGKAVALVKLKVEADGEWFQLR